MHMSGDRQCHEQDKFVIGILPRPKVLSLPNNAAHQIQNCMLGCWSAILEKYLKQSVSSANLDFRCAPLAIGTNSRLLARIGVDSAGNDLCYLFALLHIPNLPPRVDMAHVPAKLRPGWNLEWSELR